VAGTDGIHPELIKYRENKLLNKIYELLRQICWEEERIPEEWKETLIFPMYNKGDGDRCENYRKCSLQNFGKCNFGKIKPYIEKIAGDYLNGFRDGRSIINNIFVLKLINEKIWEYNQSLQHLFIDFEKACDSVHRDMLWKWMEEFKIPEKLINMCKTYVQKTRSAVRIEGTLSSFVENKTIETGDYHQYYSI